MNHEALETFAANYYAHFNYHEGSVHLVVAPMTHSAGIMGCLHFMRGGKNVVTKHVDPLSIMQDIDEHKVTHLFLPPTVMYMMLAHEDINKYDYSSPATFHRRCGTDFIAETQGGRKGLWSLHDRGLWSNRSTGGDSLEGAMGLS